MLVLASSPSVVSEELSTSPMSSPPEKESQRLVREYHWVKLLTLTTIDKVKMSTMMHDLSNGLVGGRSDSVLGGGIVLRGVNVGASIFSVLFVS